MRNIITMTVFVLAMIFASAANADFILNGDVESGAFTPWVSSGHVAVVKDSTYRASGGVGQFPRGNYAVNFGGADKVATGVIYQDFATTPFSPYRLTFNYGAFGTLPNGTPQNPQSVRILAIDNQSSNSVFSASVTDATQSLLLGSLMERYEFHFTAAGVSTRLMFLDQSGNSFSVDGVLDNISVTSVNSVPEPNSLILLALGVGSGWYLRRKGNNRTPVDRALKSVQFNGTNSRSLR